MAGGKASEDKTKKSTPSRKASPSVYQVTLLDVADNSVLIQFVRAKSGIDAGNHALTFDQNGEAREDGYRVVTVISRKDISVLSEDARKVAPEVVTSVKPKGDRSWFNGSLISD